MVWANAEVGNLNDKAIQMKSDYMFCRQTQNEKRRQLMMLSELWASFPSLSLPDRCNWCSLWGEAPCPGESGGCGARACSPPCRPLLPRQPAVLSFLTLHVHVRLCSFCSSVKTNWEVWGETDKPGITQQSQQEEMAPRWPVGAFVQGGERAPRADTTFTAQITGFLLPSVPNEVDLTCNICKIKLLAGPTNLAIPKP